MIAGVRLLSNSQRHRGQAGMQRAGSSAVLAVLLVSVHEQWSFSAILFDHCAFDAARLSSSLWSKLWSIQQALT